MPQAIIPTIIPTLLLILDGFGIAPKGPGNAITLAKTPNLDALQQKAAYATLSASGRDVGLPSGLMGNSEVGHMNIGAGRVVYQDLTRIDIAVEDNSISSNPAIQTLLADIKQQNGAIHFMGLVSDGGVHSNLEHLKKLVTIAKNAGVTAFIHAFMDGRDTSPTSGLGYIQDLTAFLNQQQWGTIATISGRYYAMDRDKHYERNELAWNAMVHGKGIPETDSIKTLENAYSNKETDEFLKPRVLFDTNKPCGIIKDGDGIFFFNFRADRARQIVQAFITPDFSEYNKGTLPKLAGFATMTAYDSSFHVPVAFSKKNIAHTLGQVISEAGLTQFRIAETEKYAHVTYFLNGGREDAFAGEERCLVPSPREVATYDLKPAMSAPAVTKNLIEALQKDTFSLIVCNLANPDMVGHTGIIPAAIEAIEDIDACIGQIASVILAKGGNLFITADHGNAECMIAEDGTPHTAHTTNLVPFLWLKGTEKNIHTLDNGRLCDIAPTLLHTLGLQQPQDMTGVNLIK